MTAEEREAAVEALRCAADLNAGISFRAMGDDLGQAVREAAQSAWQAADSALLKIWGTVDNWHKDWWRTITLEAAALLEDGWNPGEPVEDLVTGDPVERRG